METVAVQAFEKSLLTMKMVKFPDVSVDDQHPKLAELELLFTRFLPNTLERNG